MNTKDRAKRRRTDNRIRTALATNLGRCLVALIASDNREALEEALAIAGYSSISTEHESEDIGRAIASVTSLLDLDDLAAVVHTASFHVALGNGEWDFADRAAAATLKQCGRGVLRRFLARDNAAKAVRS